MSFSFIDIEEKKSKVIALIFFCLIFFYFLTAYLLLLAAENTFLFSFEEGRTAFILPPLSHILIALLVAFSLGLLHWSISTGNLIEKISLSAGAFPVDSKDTYHQYFKNIVDEVSVATGGRRIEAMVIPSSGLNAFSLQDFNGRAVVGITEGLLARLNRSQIEAVVGHEAAHIVNGDSLVATVTTSLSELYEDGLMRLKGTLRNTRGRGGLFLLLVFIIVAIMGFLSRLLRFFISRQREYRADAVAVRLTRNPLSLAEGLKMISTHWRGSGAQGEKLESIFIVNPNYDSLDESEGLISDLFSTHPPVKQRINILLDMAHLDEKTLEENLENFKRVSPVAVSEFKPEYDGTPRKWFIFTDKDWQGPFSLEELSKIQDLRPDQWIRPEGMDAVIPAYEDLQVRRLFAGDKKEEKEAGIDCPYCKVPLEEINYEGAPILKCHYCQGVLAEQDKISRILIREDKNFSEETMRLAKSIIASKDRFRLKDSGSKSVLVINCPKCKRPMRRQFFVYSYPVEVDRCIYCPNTWFDKQELELLQYIYEHKESFLF